MGLELDSAGAPLPPKPTTKTNTELVDQIAQLSSELVQAAVRTTTAKRALEECLAAENVAGAKLREALQEVRRRLGSPEGK